ncbi:MAG: DMT family transporter [Clostridiales bacterium]|nr:DMT family transporter [Clostridiales bacterium]
MQSEWKRDPKVWGAIVAALLFWASAFAGIRAAFGGHGGADALGYGAGEVALGRFLTASMVLAAWALATRMRAPDPRDIWHIALAGLLGITVYHVALNFGELTVTAGAASLIISANPIFTAVLSTMFLGERLSGWGWSGVTVSFLGVALIAFGEGGTVSFEPAALLVLLAAMATALYFIVSKPLLKKYSALEFTAYAIWAGTVPMLVFAPGLIEQHQVASHSATLSVLYLGVFPGAIAYALWSYALARMPASLLSSFLYAQPVIAVIIAWFWLAEIPALLTIAGGLISLAGVVVVNAKGVQRVSARST